MDFGTPGNKRRRTENGHVSVIQEPEKGDDLSFYSFPPVGKIDLFEVDDMVEERLSILEVFEELKISEMSTAANLKDHLINIRKRIDMITSKSGDNFITTLHTKTHGASHPLMVEARRRDQISHFLLRLYFCQPQEKKTWYVSKEAELLRFRLLLETVVKSSNAVVSKMITNNGLNFELIVLKDTEEDRKLKHNITFNSFSAVERDKDKSSFYRIAFEKALDVIRTRKAFMQGGYAYVTTHDMISLICARFRNELSMSLATLTTKRKDEENRLIPVMNQIYVTKASAARKLKADASGKMVEVITPNMIDGLALEHFPPCMENIHLSLRKNHHTKYGGRLHYGLFLKGIGLSLEDAIKFFRAEFIQKIAPEKFDKEYRYGIRYNYGKEGKKVDFSPYGCEKIQTSSVSIGDSHGCPFKHFELGILKKYLSRKGVSDQALETMETLIEEKNYSQACTIYFSARHPGHRLGEEGITHPNSFFTESRKALAKNPKREEVMLDEDIDHNVLPIETVILNSQQTESSQVYDEDSEPMETTESPVLPDINIEEVEQIEQKEHVEESGGIEEIEEVEESKVDQLEQDDVLATDIEQ